jgi:prepilin-type N-terminal cleavage/methylation domain-containing protein
MKNQPFCNRRTRSGAFTLIEMLVVIGIIGILAALILGTASIASSKMRRAKAEGERDALITAIQSYKNKKGFYPPDNTNSTTVVPLFYELTGTVVTNFGGGNSFLSRVSGDRLTAANLNTIFGNANISGFVNSSADPSEVQNFCPTIAKSGRTAAFTTNGITYTLFGIFVRGPVELDSADGKKVNPWHYVSTNPTNNNGSYDLWIDVVYSGKTNRISNWSKDPEPL